VPLEDGIIAVVGDGVEIEVEGIAGEAVLAIHELMPGGEQAGDPGGIKDRPPDSCGPVLLHNYYGNTAGLTGTDTSRYLAMNLDMERQILEIAAVCDYVQAVLKSPQRPQALRQRRPPRHVATCPGPTGQLGSRGLPMARQREGGAREKRPASDRGVDERRNVCDQPEGRRAIEDESLPPRVLHRALVPLAEAQVEVRASHRPRNLSKYSVSPAASK
jgi:hypothetical protein